jgi:hypothetical protein
MSFDQHGFVTRPHFRARNLYLGADELPSRATLGPPPEGVERGHWPPPTPSQEEPQPRPLLNGVRIKWSGSYAVYLVDGGLRRLIPDQETYDNIFQSWGGIRCFHWSVAIARVCAGEPIASGSMVVGVVGRPDIYLLDGAVKRRITSDSAMTSFHLRWPSNGRYLSAEMADAIADGTPIF